MYGYSFLGRGSKLFSAALGLHSTILRFQRKMPYDAVKLRLRPIFLLILAC